LSALRTTLGLASLGLATLLVQVAACSYAVPPEVAKIAIRNDQPAARCEKVGPVHSTHSGNDMDLILEHARNKLRSAAHALGANYVRLDKTEERGVGLGWHGMGGVGPEISLSGEAYRCSHRR
jgi:hypothetical protein